jgi:hypothetical protein
LGADKVLDVLRGYAIADSSVDTKAAVHLGRVAFEVSLVESGMLTAVTEANSLLHLHVHCLLEGNWLIL